MKFRKIPRNFCFLLIFYFFASPSQVLEEDRRRIRDRLLQRIKDNKDANNNSAGKDDDDDSQSEIYLDKQHNWQQQIAWEETHLGGFRRIMPCPNDKDRYQKFYVQQNQLSVYSETAASKRREECAKQQRIELEEKFKHNQHILRQFRFGKNVNGEDDIVRKKKVKKNKRNFFKADDIGESDERERATSMSQRDFVVKSCGLLQTVKKVSFYRFLRKFKAHEGLIKQKIAFEANENHKSRKRSLNNRKNFC